MLSCPWCDSEVVILEIHMHWFKVKCTFCGARSPGSHTEGEAKRRWQGVAVREDCRIPKLERIGVDLSVVVRGDKEAKDA